MTNRLKFLNTPLVRSTTVVQLCFLIGFALLSMTSSASKIGVEPFEPHVVIHKYVQLSTQSKAIAESAAQTCEDNKSVDDKSLKPLQGLWLDLAKSWSQTSMLYGPPVNKDNRNLRINAWPNRKDSVEKQITLAIEQKNAPTLKFISEASVLLQGLPAVEALVFSETYYKENNYCALLTAVTAYLNENLESVANDWKDYYQNTPVETVLDDLFNGLLNRAKLVQKYKTPQLVQAKSLPLDSYSEFPRSKQSFKALSYNIFSLCDILDYAEGDVGDKVDLVCQIIATSFDEIDVLKDTGSLPEESKITISEALDTLIVIVEKEFMPSYGVTVDFNSLDGD